MKVAVILGTRPEIIKLSPVIRQLEKRQINFFIIHSNQHYSKNMDAVFFDELKLQPPKYHLNVGSGPHGEMTAKILTGVEKNLLTEKPDWVLVQGDTNTVIAGALAAVKLNLKVGHIEAGLRSYDQTMPEEINRIVTDHISTALFAPTQKQAKILQNEGIEAKKILVTGNTIVDAVYQNLNLINQNPRLNHYQKQGYFLLTLHRPSNVDCQETLTKLLNIITEVSIKYQLPVLFPVHPRTQKQIDLFGLKFNPKHIKTMEPVGYLEMLAIEKNAKLIFTDSGGIQEEACILQVPSLTLRDNTERPETLEVGASLLIGAKYDKILEATEKMINKSHNWPNPFGGHNSSEKIVDFLVSV